MEKGPFWEDPEHSEWSRKWRQRYARHGHRRMPFFLVRMAIGIVVMTIVAITGISVLGFLVTRIFGRTGPGVMFAGAGSIVLIFFVLILVVFAGRRIFRGMGAPLVTIMDAADRVADGDLSVRVPENYPAEFGNLARSFNRMTSELVRADEQRRHLVADVAHELRTPLHIIQGNLEGIVDGVYQPTNEHINATLEETRLLARLVDDLQTLSRAEAGQLPLDRESVDIHELLADVYTSFSGQAEAAGVELSVESNNSGAPLTIQADRGRLDQVLGNLVANALRYTPAGGKISLRAEPLEHSVRLSVQDTGEGISAEDLPFIFDRFWRSDQARSHQGGAGSGLGLAISRQLVQAHGGTIRVESQPGAGTTFTIELPADGGKDKRS